MSGQTIIPIPQSSLGTVEQGSGRIIMSREWYRFFGLIQSALGGSTDVVGDFSIQSPPEQIVGETLALMVGALIDASGQAAAARATVADLQRRVADLEMMQRGLEEIPYQRLTDLEILMPGLRA